MFRQAARHMTPRVAAVGLAGYTILSVSAQQASTAVTVKDRDNCYIDHVVTAVFSDFSGAHVKRYEKHLWPDDLDPYAMGYYYQTIKEHPTEVPEWVMKEAQKKAAGV